MNPPTKRHMHIMNKFHDTPVETRAWLVDLFDLATDAQKEQIAWAIARGDFPVGFEKVDDGKAITIYFDEKRSAPF